MSRASNGRAVAMVAMAAVALLAALPAATDQADPEEPRGRFREEVQVTEVLLDVVVTDKRGQVIVGLGPDDLLVVEDGVEMELTGLTFYSSMRLLTDEEPLERSGLDVDPAPSERFFIFFIQDQRRAGSSMHRLVSRQLEAGRELTYWIENEMQGGDLAAVASYDLKLRVHQDFTADRAALARAVDDAVRGVDPGTDWPSRRAETAADAPSLLAGMPVGKELRKRSKSIYRALELLAITSGAVQGRKNLVFFGIGFGEIDHNGVYQPDRRYFSPMVQTLNDNNVAVYTVDVSPLGTRHTLRQALNHLAADTGGEMFYQEPRFRGALRGVDKATSGYYLLSYRATHPAGTSGYQRVRVAARNPQFRVRARQGYLYGASE